MSEVYEIIDQYLAAGKTGILATIVDSAGSSPRDAGAKMFVGEDGRTFGTIGGGSVEAEVTRQAQAMAGAKEAKIFHYAMQGSAVEAEGMICGGNVDVFLEPVLGRYRDLYKAIEHCERGGRRALIVTRFGPHLFSKSLVDLYGGTWGEPLDEQMLGELHDYFDEKRPVVIDGNRLLEPIRIASSLYIFGAGHVSQFLAKVAKMVDFNVTVIDDREEFVNAARFPDADSLFVDAFNRVFDRFVFTGNEYVVIVTRGHRHDAQVVEDVLKRETKYVGMIGSKRKVAMVLDYLAKKGFTKETLRRVYAPIGIDINSETPQEIAISIVAELIKVRGEA